MDKTVKNACPSARRHKSAATKRTPLGARAASWSVGVTSRSIGGGSSEAIALVSPDEVMMFSARGD